MEGISRGDARQQSTDEWRHNTVEENVSDT